MLRTSGQFIAYHFLSIDIIAQHITFYDVQEVSSQTESKSEVMHHK